MGTQQMQSPAMNGNGSLGHEHCIFCSLADAGAAAACHVRPHNARVLH